MVPRPTPFAPSSSHHHRQSPADAFSPVVFALRNHKIVALRELLALVWCKPGPDDPAAAHPPLQRNISAPCHSLSRRSIRVGLVNTFDAMEADASSQSAETVVDLAAEWGNAEAMSLVLGYRQGFFVNRRAAQEARIPCAVSQASPSTVHVRCPCPLHRLSWHT